MEPSHDIFKLTQHYLHNKLSASERESFEERFQNDSEFAAEVERCKVEIAAVDHAGEQQLRAGFKRRFEAAQKKHRRFAVRRVW